MFLGFRNHWPQFVIGMGRQGLKPWPMAGAASVRLLPRQLFGDGAGPRSRIDSRKVIISWLSGGGRTFVSYEFIYILPPRFSAAVSVPPPRGARLITAFCTTLQRTVRVFNCAGFEPWGRLERLRALHRFANIQSALAPTELRV